MLDDFTVMLDEYVILGTKDGICYYWSDSIVSCMLFLRVNKSLHDVKLLHV